MTTKVTVYPAGHKIEVALGEGSPDDRTTTTETLDVGSPPRDFWIYDDRSITVREVAEQKPAD